MIAMVGWGEAALTASTLLMLLVLALRTPIRRWLGPQLAYSLWAIPALRLIVPRLPADLFGITFSTGRVATAMSVLAVGPSTDFRLPLKAEVSAMDGALLAIYAAGTLGVAAFFALRHFSYCSQLRTTSNNYGTIGTIRIIAAHVEGPLAFGVLQRFIAVPHSFARDYSPAERDLALAHEVAHHARGDLLANWLSLAVLALHWWNPVAWIAMRAFREDQEFAVDAQVLAARQPEARPLYAQVLVKAAGIGALPACNLHARSNLKGRLMMLGQTQGSNRRLVLGGIALILLGGAALTATAASTGASGSATGKQVVTIGVKPDGAGSYALIIGKSVVAASAPLPGGKTLPADLAGTGGCDLKPSAKPFAMVIKGMGATQTYTIMCASAAPAPVRTTLAEGLSSLNTMRASVASQPATAVFPEAERKHALGAIDRSIREVKATIAAG